MILFYPHWTATTDAANGVDAIFGRTFDKKCLPVLLHATEAYT